MLISGKPEIRARFLSFNFANSLICAVGSSALIGEGLEPLC
jgi:hypothetical protein